MTLKISPQITAYVFAFICLCGDTFPFCFLFSVSLIFWLAGKFWFFSSVWRLFFEDKNVIEVQWILLSELECFFVWRNGSGFSYYSFQSITFYIDWFSGKLIFDREKLFSLNFNELIFGIQEVSWVRLFGDFRLKFFEKLVKFHYNL